MILETEPAYVEPGFLDCGAHSVHTGLWTELPFDDYVDFTIEFNGRFDIIAGPDVVGDSKATELNILKYLKRVEGKVPFHKIIPTYHLQAKSFKDLDRVVEYAVDAGLTRIALGGALGVGFTAEQKYVSLKLANERIPRDKLQLHLFGIHAPEFIRISQPDSVDSSTFLAKAKFMKRLKYSISNWGGVDNDLEMSYKHYRKEEFLDYCCEELVKYRPVLGRLEYLVDDMVEVRRAFDKAPGSVPMMILNLLAVRDYERKMQISLDYPFKYFTTCTVEFMMRYSPIVKDLLRYCWGDRALVSYSQIWGQSDRKVERLVGVFKEVSDDIPS